LKPAFCYYAVLGATEKIDFALSVLIFGKMDREWLLRSQRREKLDHGYGGNATIFAPLHQSGQGFIENHYARHDRRARKMPGQTGMISANYATYFKVHLAEVSLIKRIQQLHRAGFVNPPYRRIA
jgi:hypothetical protein